jgi:Fe-S cluster assembly protein SufD
LAISELPTEAEEVWRYSRVSDVDMSRFAPVAAGPDGAAAASGSRDVPPEVDRLLEAVGARAALLLTRNGRIAAVDLGDEAAAAKLELGPLGEVGTDNGGLGAVAGESDAFVTMNAAFTAEPIVIRVPRGVVLEQPIVVVHWIDADGAAVFPRTIVQLGEAAEATVVEVVASPDIVALAVPVTEITVEPAGILRYVTVQLLGPSAWQIAHQASTVGSQSTLVSATVAIGGDYARMRTDSRLVGAGATGNLLAVYFGSGHQMHDFRTLQDHEAPKSTSDLLFKGAVAGTAHSVYSGLIRVHPGAKGTVALQTNRNLVLSEGARADSVPNLEIEENEVSCSHASAVGPVDEEQRYYLESRGVPTEVADRLIVLGFLNDVVERIPVTGLRSYLEDVLSDKLDRSETSLGGAA